MDDCQCANLNNLVRRGILVLDGFYFALEIMLICFPLKLFFFLHYIVIGELSRCGGQYLDVFCTDKEFTSIIFDVACTNDVYVTICNQQTD